MDVQTAGIPGSSDGGVDDVVMPSVVPLSKRNTSKLSFTHIRVLYTKGYQYKTFTDTKTNRDQYISRGRTGRFYTVVHDVE
jgi:hypothetical protein